MNKTVLSIFIVIFLFGCKERKYSEIVEFDNQEYGNIPAKLIDSLQLISGVNQKFNLDNSKSNTLIGKKGTVILIPEKSIVDENGKNVKGKIIIELKENFTIKDFITSNLQTIHNEQILESEGMIFLSAKDKKGNKLKISKNSSIRIQIPQKSYRNDKKIFLGERKKDGLINWTKIEEPAKSLVPYPIKFISRNHFPTECCNFYGITKDTIKSDCFTYYGELSDFENTLLATKEFAERYQSTCWEEVIKLYIQNLDKNLWEIDEMVVKHFIKDSIKRVEFAINSVYPGPNGNPRTKDQIEAHQWLVNNAKENSHKDIELYKYFAAQKLTKIDKTKIIDTTKINNINSAIISYDAMNFGWINVDFFYDDPKATQMKLVAKSNQKAILMSLIINGRKVILSGTEHSPNEFWFTKNKNGYNKLPKGEKATIIAIGLNETDLLFAEKEIIIGDSEIEKLNLKAITIKNMKLRLEKYGS